MRDSRDPELGVNIMATRLNRWLHDVMRRVQSGQGLVEYGLLITLISIAAIAIMSIMGGSVSSLYSQATTVFP